MVKNPPCNMGDLGSIPGSGRCPGGGHPVFGQWSLAGHSPWGQKESDMTERLSPRAIWVQM